MIFETEAGLKKAYAKVNSLEEIESVENKAKECDIIEITTDNALIDFESRRYFFVPRKVTYKLVAPQSEEDYLMLLKKKKRKSIIKSANFCKEEGIEIKTEEPISRETFLEWEKIYDANIARKKIGIKRIGLGRFLSVQHKTAGIFAYKDNKLIGGIMLMHKKFLMDGELHRKISISLSSSERDYFKTGINEVLNFEVIKFCQRRGIKFIERGMDANLYGHYLNPGLYVFKKSMGYRITFKPKYGFCWRKIINFEKFDKNIFFISIGDKGLEGNLFFRVNMPNIKDYKSPHLKRINIFSINDNVAVKVKKLIVN